MNIRKGYSIAFSNFLHILNDSMFKMISIFYLLKVCGLEYKGYILTFNSLAFAVPYILFSIPAGKLTDRFYAKSVIIINKIFEILIFLTISMYVYMRFLQDSHKPFQDILVNAILIILLGIRTCMFTPSRYFIVNHMFSGDTLKKVTTIISISSYAGMLVGLLGASVLSNVFHKKYVFAFLINVIFSFIGLFSFICLRIPNYTANSDNKLSSFGMLKAYSKKKPKLLLAMAINVIFMGLSIFYQMNAINYAIEALKLDETYSGYLYFFVGAGMSLGILLGLKFCQISPEHYFPISGIGAMCSGFFVFALYFAKSLVAASVLMALSGIFIGIFIIPTEIFIQGVCPKPYIPLNTGIMNFLGFVSIAISALLIYLASVFAINSRVLFAILGIYMIVMGIAIISMGKAYVRKMRLD